MAHWIFGPGAVGRFLAQRMSEHPKLSRPVLIGRADPLPTDARPPDAIWIATPAWGVASVLGRGLPSGVPVLIASNGLGLLDSPEAAALQRTNPLFRAALWLGVSLDPNSGEVTLHGLDRVEIAPPSPFFAEILEQIKIRAVLQADASRLEWRKALANLVINPVCTLAGRENRVVLSDPILRARGEALLNESRTVAQAVGVTLSTDDRAQVWRTAELTGDNLCSMLRAKKAGKSTEIDFLTGYVVRLARARGIPTPASDEILREFLMTQLQ